MKRARFVLFAIAGMLAFQAAWAPVRAAEPDDGTRAALLKLKDEMVDAVNRREIERLVSYGTDDVVVTFQNGETCRGRDGVRAFFDRMTKGPSGLVAEYQTMITVEGMTMLPDGGGAVAYGASSDKLKLSSGAEFNLEGRWSATLVRSGDQWKVASLHFSNNLFENPVLERMKTTTYLMAAFGFIMGLTLGLLILVVNSVRKKKEPQINADDPR